MYHGKIIAIAIFLVTALTCQYALADDCDNLKANQEWITGMKQIQIDYKASQFDKVITKGEELSYICARSPELNYNIAKAYAAIGQHESAIVYFDIASDAADEFHYSSEFKRKVIYARYESEHPENSETTLKALQDEKAQLENQNQAYQKDIDNLNKKINKLEEARVETPTVIENHSNDQFSTQIKDAYGSAMCAGIGIGVTGLVALGIGAGLLGTTDKYEHIDYTPTEFDEKMAADYGTTPGTHNIQNYDIKPKYIAGWSLVGAGIAATVSGIILIGIYGYKYNNVDDVSLSISPTGFEFGLKF